MQSTKFPELTTPRASAIVEIFGLKDLAADSPGEFKQCIVDFHKAIDQLRGDVPQLVCFENTDFCIFTHPFAFRLLYFLRELRGRLFRKGIVIRALTIPQETAPVVINTVSKKGIQLDEIGCTLKARVEQIKGLCLMVDEQFFDHPSFGKELEKFPENDRERCRELVFKNCYFPLSNDEGHVEFNDIRIEPKATIAANTDLLVSLVRRACLHSTKVARFFIPLLINWARHMDLSTRRDAREENKARPGRGLDFHIVRRELGCLSNVTGHTLLYATLIDRLYPKPKNFSDSHIDPERWTLMHEYLVNHAQKLLTEIRSDEKGTRIRDYILRRASRRAFHIEVAEYRPRLSRSSAQAERPKKK